MDAAEILRLKAKLTSYLKDFRDCFCGPATRKHLFTYVRGQLSTMDRKSVEPIALSAGVAPRTLQQFLNSLSWSESLLTDILQWRVARDHTSPHSIGLIDETSCVKKGDKTPGVQRQWCGSTGKVDNCVTTVHLGYAVDDFHCLLDSELFLPEVWDQDRERCRAAHIPDEVVYRPKWRIALELYDRARTHHVSFAYLTFDEGYGSKPEFLRELDARGQRYVAEVPRSFTGWTLAPRVTDRPYRKHGRGRGRKTPRVAAGGAPARSVEHHLRYAQAFAKQPWNRWVVKDTHKGPLVWETKHVMLFSQDEEGLPGKVLHLIAARNVNDHNEVKYFVSNAPADTPLEELMLVAFSRWHVERCFEDQKTELGFDHFEGRSYRGMKRHQAVTAVTHLFLSEVHQDLRGEKPGADGVPGADGGGRPDSIRPFGGQSGPHHPRGRRSRTEIQAEKKRCRPRMPRTQNHPKTRGKRHPSRPATPMRMARRLAL